MGMNRSSLCWQNHHHESWRPVCSLSPEWTSWGRVGSLRESTQTRTRVAPARTSRGCKRTLHTEPAHISVQASHGTRGVAQPRTASERRLPGLWIVSQ